MRCTLLASSLAAAVLAGPAFAATAETQEKVSGSDVVQVLQLLGYQGTASIDSYGEPQVDTNMGGVPVTVFFYNCDKAASPMTCGELHLSATFQLSRPVTAEMTNRYNSGTRYGQAYVQDGVPKVDLSLQLKGGVTLDNFKAYFEQFATVVGEFEQRLFTQ